MSLRVAVLGGGAWGTALAMQMRRAGCDVRLWARDAEAVSAIRRGENPRYLPGIRIDGGIEATADSAEALEGAGCVLVVTPAQALRPYVKRTFQPTRVDMLPLALRQSYNLMLTGRPGPVNLDVPFNLFQEEDDVEIQRSDQAAGFARPGAAPEDIRRLVDMIQAAQRPAFFVSHGVTLAEAGPELTRVAELLDIPVITQPNGMGALPMPHRS